MGWEKEWGVGPLNEEQRKKHPEIIICFSDTSLFYYIETGQSLGEAFFQTRSLLGYDKITVWAEHKEIFRSRYLYSI